jgi:hypothetical protein
MTDESNDEDTVPGRTITSSYLFSQLNENETVMASIRMIAAADF